MSFSFQVIAAPMAGISNRSYRDIVRSMGADLAYGEMVSAQAITYGNKKTLELMDIGDEASPRLVQLFGSSPEHIQEAAAVAKDLGADYIDINMGCPVPKVVRNGEGSALMREPALAEALVKAAASVGLPVSVKIRAGWDAAHRNAVEFAQRMESAGAAFIAVHGRTREQFYTGQADWQIIADVKKAVQIPVIGNGDIFEAADALRMLEHTGCDGVMVGRGMLGNPWVFADIKAVLSGKPPAGRPQPQVIIDQALSQLREHICRSSIWLCNREGKEDAATMQLAEELAVCSMRNQLGWYLKGLRHAAELRRQLNTLKHYDEIAALFTKYLSQDQL